MRVILGLPAIAMLLGLVLSLPAEARTLRGTVAAVVDGDTVRVKLGKRTRTFDLHGIEAPRLDGACYGKPARDQLRRLVHRKAVRVRIVRGRNIELLVGSRNINRAMVAGGHARAKAGGGARGARLRADETRARARGLGLHGACAPAGSPPQGGPSPAPGDVTGQPAITELTANLTGMAFRRAFSSGSSTTNIELHLCPGGAFRYWEEESFSSSGAFLNLRSESLGQWRVTEAQVKADGTRTATVQGTVASQASNNGPEPVTEPQATLNIEFTAGQWRVAGQLVLASPGAASCAPLLRHN